MLSTPVGRTGGNILTQQGKLDRPGSKPTLSLNGCVNLQQSGSQQSNDKVILLVPPELFPKKPK